MSFYPFINKNSVLLTKYSILKCVYNARKMQEKYIKNKKKLKMDADVF